MELFSPRAIRALVLLCACALAAPASARQLPAAGRAARSDRGAPLPAECWLGRWQPPVDHRMDGFAEPHAGGFNAVHMALIPTGPQRGKVLVWDTQLSADSDHGHRAPGPGPQDVQRYSIAEFAQEGGARFENAELPLPDGEGDLFCAGFAWTADGTLFLAGGTRAYPVGPGEGFVGGLLVYVWDPRGGGVGAWHRQPDLALRRWYPTVTLLSDDRLMVSGGIEDTTGPSRNDYEVFELTSGDPPSGRWLSDGGNRVLPGPGYQYTGLGIYPRMHLLSTGEVFNCGFIGNSTRVDPLSFPVTWTFTDGVGWEITRYNCTALFQGLASGQRDVVVRLGGEPRSGGAIHGTTDEVWRADLSQPGSPGWDWQPLAPLNRSRMFANLVVLPDGSMLVLGGRTNASTEVPGEYTRSTELYRGGVWTELAPMRSVRDYHASALLLPDGRVLVAGGNHRDFDYEVFEPPYLACGRPRPRILQAPSAAGYAQSHTLDFAHPGGAAVSRVVLIRPAATTHHEDYDQRWVDLVVTSLGPTRVSFDTPPDSGTAPRGWYMLFLVDAEGVPSEASWIELR